MRTVIENLNRTLNFENLEICGIRACRYDSEGVSSEFANFFKGVTQLVQVQNGDTHGMPFDFTEAEKLKSGGPAKESANATPPAKKNWWEPN